MKNSYKVFAILVALSLCFALAGCDNNSDSSPSSEIVSVMYISNGHGDVPDANVAVVGHKLTEPRLLVEEGYVFGGWYKDAECTEKWDFDSDIVTASLTLYAKWTIGIYAVAYDASGHGMAPAAVTAEFGSKLTEPEAPAAVGYTFLGWYKDAECTDKWDFANDTVTGAFTLYAKWKDNDKVALSYDKNAGSDGVTGMPADQEVNSGVSVTVDTAKIPVRSGYTFAGWCEDAEGNTFAASSYTLTADRTLYAKWEGISYSVKFDGNESTGGAMSDLAMTYGTAANLTDNAFVRTGYEFAGWAATSGGEVEYADGVSVSNLTTTDGDIVTLYAKWEGIGYKIAFDGNGSTGGAMSDLAMTYGTAANLTDNAFVKTGYEFAGWAATSGGEVEYADGASVSNLTATENAVVNLYAKWTLRAPEFSVSGSRKVRFSKGNLYWDGDSFEFEASQTAYKSSWDANHLSLFYWSKDSGIARSGDFYSDTGAVETDVLFTNKTIKTANPDFTANGEKGKWRALSNKELEYLLGYRDDAEEKVGYATIGEVYGLILLPDYFEDPMKNDGSKAFAPKLSWDANIYDSAGWAAMEAVGAVFLPAAGGRRGNSIFQNSGSEGLYWTSTSYSTKSWAYNLDFLSTNVNASSHAYRECGYAIRLVCDVVE